MEALLMLNSDCNMKCRHCYLQYSGNRDPKDALETVIKLKEAGHRLFIAGSEVLQDRRYLESYRQAGQTNILTNGILLKSDPSLYYAMSRAEIRTIEFSIHFGLERILGSVPEDNTVEVIRESRRRGFQTLINTTITSINYTNIMEMCHLAKEYSADELHFIRFMNIGKAKELPDLSLNESQLTEFFRNISKARARYQKKDLVISMEGNFGPKPGSRGEILARENRYCPAADSFIVIAPDNTIYPCPFMMEPKYAIGIFDGKKIVINKEFMPGIRDRCIAHETSRFLGRQDNIITNK